MKTENEKFRDQLQYGQAPDVCVGFVKKDDGSKYPDKHRYRVTGWYKMVDPEALKREQAKLYKPGVGSMLNDILIDASHQRDGMLIMHCTREEATHVGGAGVGGCIAAVKDIIYDDHYINWPKDIIDQHRESALKNVGEYIF